MKEKVLIGEKMTKKGVAKNYLLLSYFGIMMVVGYRGMISPYLHLNNQIEVLVMILIYLAVLVFLTSIIGSSESIEFSQDEVRYYHVKGYCQQFVEVLRIIRGKKEVPNITLKTRNIQAVQLSYATFMMAWAQKGYQLKMTFLMNDGSIMVFFPTSYDQMEKGDYEKALQILESNGIQIKDKFNLRKALSMNKYSFYEYVKEIEEGRNKL